MILYGHFCHIKDWGEDKKRKRNGDYEALTPLFYEGSPQ